MKIEGDKKFVNYLSKNKYHPRSDAHGNEMCRLILNDLIHNCPKFKEGASKGEIIYKINHTIDKGTRNSWNMDLVVGPPIEKSKQSLLIEGISSGEPSEVWMAIDAKAIMTEHGKASDMTD